MRAKTHRPLCTLACALALHACAGRSQPAQTAGSAAAADRAFVAIADGYIEQMLELAPEWATDLGEHRHDARLTDRGRAGIARRLALQRATLAKLRSVDAAALGPDNRIDLEILRHNVERQIFEAESIRPHERNPLYYNFGQAIFALLGRDFAPERTRLRYAIGRLSHVPRVVAAARANLLRPPRLHVETAIGQNRGNIALLDRTLRQALGRYPELQREAERPLTEALAALRAYGKWLKKELLPRADGDFRLGDALWRKRLRFSLHSALSKEEIYRRARADLAATQRAMHEIARELYPRLLGKPAPETTPRALIKAVLDKLAEARPNDETVVAFARRTLEQTTRFVRDKQLMTVPDQPVEIIVMPEFARGVAIAYCDSPGPLEQKAQTFYAIAPTPADWTPERRTSFYREYNNYMMHELTIHEAMPGHYLQAGHASTFRAPTRVRAVFASGSFVEGWAMYGEAVMAEAGYGGPRVRIQQLKLRLRAIINAIIDQKIHTEGMTEAQAMALMTEQGFQEEGEAAGKWRRACLTSTQLSTYFVGTAEVTEAAIAYRKAHGDASLRAMHDRMLSFGAPPPGLLPTLLEQ